MKEKLTLSPVLLLKKGKTKSRCFCNGLLVCLCKLDSAGYFTRTQATGAGVDVARCAVDNCLNALYVGFPSSVGSSVRMGNLDSERDVLTADIAFCHVSAPPYTTLNKVNSNILSDSQGKCKLFFEKSEIKL